MRVVLTAEVKGVGRKGEVKEVAEGYARNFLYARNLAVSADDLRARLLLQEMKKRASDAQKEIQRAQSLMRRLNGITLELVRRANDKNTLFAAVTAKEIADELRAQGYEVAENEVRIVRPIKQKGDHEARVVSKGSEARVRIIIH